MSGVSVEKPLPMIDAEECIPHIARLTKRASNLPFMEMIEEEEPSQIDSDIDSCTDSSSPASASAVSSQPSTPASVSSDEEPKNEIPKDVLEYAERIREAINTQRDRTTEEPAAELAPKSNGNFSAKQVPISAKKQAAPLNALAERTKTMLRKLTNSRKKMSTLLVVKPKAKVRSEKQPASLKPRTVLIGSTKIGQVQYVHEDKKDRPISLSAACDSASDKEEDSSLKSPCAVHDEDESHAFWTDSMVQRPKYDLRTGRRLGESRSLDSRVKDAAIKARRSAVKGIEISRKQVSKRRGKGKGETV